MADSYGPQGAWEKVLVASIIMVVPIAILAIVINGYREYRDYQTRDQRINERVEAWSDMMKRQCTYEGGTTIVWVDTGRYKSCKQ